MRVVADANLLVALFVRLDYSPQARATFRDWMWQGIDVFAPQLWFYEAISTLRKLSALGRLSEGEAHEALDEFGHLEIKAVEPSPELGRRALDWAQKLNQLAAYDAAYLAVAESLDADFWTADQRLARNAKALGVEWVHSVQEEGQLPTTTTSS